MVEISLHNDKYGFLHYAKIQDGWQKWQAFGYTLWIKNLAKITLFQTVFDKIANLISKLNFYKLIPYPMDNSLSGRRGPARQMSEKDVLCLHWPGRPSTVHSPDGVSYFLPV